MKRLFLTATTVITFALPQLAAAQAPAPIGNNPLNSGLYVEGALGVNLADEIDFDFGDGFAESSSDLNTGFLGSLHIGYNLPQGPLNIRIEGELAGRVNAIDEINTDGFADIELENADVATGALMVNALFDYYIIPNVALTAGGGVGYANVSFDLDVIDDDDSGLAYQGRLGGRYSFNANSTISLAYTYFATSDLEATNEAGNDFDFDYTSHGLTVGFAYNF